MKYEEIVQTIEKKRRFGEKCGREILESVLPVVDHPDLGMKIIHVAGTNGKGQTSVYIAGILQAAGMNTGLFISPHLQDFTERISVNGQHISKKDVTRLGNRLLDMDWPEEGTMFDYCLLMALLYFQEKKVDYVVLETGLGGRLDATRGIKETPVISVITNIGLDHTAILGETVEEIAREKAGILRPGTLAVLSEMPEEAEEEIAKVARHLGVKYITLSEMEGRGKSSFDHTDRALPDIKGTFQRINAACAALAIRMLYDKDADLREKVTAVQISQAIEEGLRKTVWPGRLEIVGYNPLFILDGAHNPQGATALSDSLKAMFPGKRFLFMCGFLADKDYEKMVEDMEPLSDGFYTLTPPGERGLNAALLADKIKGHGIFAEACVDFQSGYEKVKKIAKETGRGIVVYGSLYLIGEVREWISKQEGKL